jgi:ATP-dependent Lon protease
MTGEISLKGRALQIGGLKEKSMAAYKAGCTSVIIPEDNVKDLAEISDEVKAGINFISVSTFSDLMPYAFEYMPVADKKANTIINDSKPAKQAVITQ